MLPECEDNISLSLTILLAEYTLADPLSILRFPCIHRFAPPSQIRRQIAAHLATELLKPWNLILKALPKECESWGKIHTSATGSNRVGRDQSFLRVGLF